MQNEAYICDAIRTPIGRYGGVLSSFRPDDLAATTIKELLRRNSGIDPVQIDDIILGCANQAGEDNRNIARMAGLLAGLPVEVTGTTVNRLCGSGMDAVGLAARAIKTNEADLIIAGGVERMSRAPFVFAKASQAFSRGAEIFDTTLGWRFVNPIMKNKFGVDALPNTAENLAEVYTISRSDQDQYALQSQLRAKIALDRGFFNNELMPITYLDKTGKKVVVNHDEHPRPFTSIEKLGALRAPFKVNGTVTSGNSSGINDGACALIVASELAIKRYNLTPLVKVGMMSTAGVAPREMGFGPVPAINKLFSKTGLSMLDIDLLECNEAFASQVLAVLKGLKLDYKEDFINPNGGAIALGHPLGMSGARIIATSTYHLLETQKKLALCSMCVGVGQGIAMMIERV
jgi:acetyl-CoA acyltransferase